MEGWVRWAAWRYGGRGCFLEVNRLRNCFQESTTRPFTRKRPPMIPTATDIKILSMKISMLGRTEASLSHRSRSTYS